MTNFWNDFKANFDAHDISIILVFDGKRNPHQNERVAQRMDMEHTVTEIIQSYDRNNADFMKRCLNQQYISGMTCYYQQ